MPALTICSRAVAPRPANAARPAAARRANAAARPLPLAKGMCAVSPIAMPMMRARRSVIVAAAEGSDVEEEERPEGQLSPAEKLRMQEKFFRDGGKAECSSCRYEYDQAQGDAEYPVAKGTPFLDLPDDWTCPVCGAKKNTFQFSSQVIAGFEANQGYGLGGNSLTGGQKSGLIFGALLLFFFIFLGGYLLD